MIEVLEAEQWYEANKEALTTMTREGAIKRAFSAGVCAAVAAYIEGRLEANKSG
jgi:hypothetical protein